MKIFMNNLLLTIRDFGKRRKHGLIQTMTVGFALGVCAVLFLYAETWEFLPVDTMLILCVVLDIAVAIIASHSYNHIPNPEANPLYEQAAKQKAIWLHSGFSWQAVNIGMTLIPLYCTCVAIYLSGTPINGQWDHTRVLFYSILSLVLSLAVYVIQPQKRQTGYHRAHLIIYTALLKYEQGGKNNTALLSDALIEGETYITEQNL